MPGSKDPASSKKDQSGGKPPQDSAVTMSQVMLPPDTNPAGNVHGGVIMKLIDSAAAVTARRHFRGNVVTASIDSLLFRNPVYVGDLVILKACLNQVGRTSMEIGVRVEAEDLDTGEIRHTASAYLTFVALDGEGRPAQAPPLVCQSPEAVRREREAIKRREARLALREDRSPGERPPQ